MGFAKYAGSRILWPPRRASVPPMNTTSARSNSAASSPMESSSKHSGQRERLRGSCGATKFTPARFSFSATMSNRSGLRGARISRSPGTGDLLERRDHRIVFIDVAWNRREAWCWRRSIFLPAWSRREIQRCSGAMPDGGRREIVFQISGDLHVIEPARRPTTNRALSSSLCTRIASGQSQHVPEKPAPAPVARQGAIGNAAVDHYQRRAGTLRFAIEIRPDFGFEHHHQRPGAVAGALGAPRTGSRAARKTRRRRARRVSDPP